MLILYKFSVCSVLIIILLSSCSLLGIEEPTFSISSIKVINGTNSDHDIAGLVFVLDNFDDRDIVSLSFEFDIYDTEGNQQPGIVENHVESFKEISILRGTEGTGIEVLDELFTLPPSESLTATRFCITGINYTDGSSWKDVIRQYLIMVTDIQVETL